MSKILWTFLEHTATVESLNKAFVVDMIKFFRGFFSKDLSIDLGTANTLIYVRDRGVVLNEPSVVALKHSNNHRSVVAIGLDAKRMLGRTPADITAVRPLKDGVIADFDVAERMLTYFITKAHENAFIRPSPRVLICVPCKSTELERRAIRESAESAGARDVQMIEEPMAAAIGAGLPVQEAVGTMVVDIGGGTSEIAVLSLSGIVHSESIRIGGDRCDEAIVDYVRRTKGMLIGDTTAERVKEGVGVSFVVNEEMEVQVMGRDLARGVPDSLTLTSREIFEALEPTVLGIVRGVQGVLEKTPPELAADIGERGLMLTGGGALMRGLSTLIAEQLELPVVVAEDPISCVARGGGRVWEFVDQGNRYDFLPDLP